MTRVKPGFVVVCSRANRGSGLFVRSDIRTGSHHTRITWDREIVRIIDSRWTSCH